MPSMPQPSANLAKLATPDGATDPSELTPEKVLARYNAARERRRTWEAHWRFSCWNEGDANLKKVLAIKPGHKVFDQCLRIARRAVGGSLEDVSGGATHYHHVNVSPPWSLGRAPVEHIGRHLFYIGIE